MHNFMFIILSFFFAGSLSFLFCLKLNFVLFWMHSISNFGSTWNAITFPRLSYKARMKLCSMCAWHSLFCLVYVSFTSRRISIVIERLPEFQLPHGSASKGLHNKNHYQTAKTKCELPSLSMQIEPESWFAHCQSTRATWRPFELRAKLALVCSSYGLSDFCSCIHATSVWSAGSRCTMH